jgi:coiled-coil domain-containing protein 55
MAAGQGRKYGLIMMSNKAKKAPSKSSNIFGSDSSDEEDTSVQKVNTSLRTSGKSWVAKQTRDAIDKAVAEDPSIFEYDAIYDEMDAKKKQMGQKTVGMVDKKPKYILQLKKAAELRKKEQEIIFEKKMKKEVDKEAEDFGDKEAFVTPSYRKILEERKAEEERLRKEEVAASGQKKDLNLFYRNLLSSRVAAREGTLDKKLVNEASDTSKDKNALTGEVNRGGDSSTERQHARRSPDRQHSRHSPDRQRSRQSPNRRRSRHSPDRRPLSHSPDRHDSRHSPAKQPAGHSPDRYQLRQSTDTDHSSNSSDEVHTMHKDPVSPGDSAELGRDSEQKVSEEVSKEILRKRKAEKRNDMSSVEAARERYLARKKAKQT